MARNVTGARRLAVPHAGSWLKLVFFGAVLVLALLALPTLIARREWVGVAVVLVVTGALFAVYAGRRRVALKYLLPGIVLLLAFQVYPVLYTVSTAFTNYGDGHRISKQEAISLIEAGSVIQVPGSVRYELSVATKGSPATDPFVYLLTAPNGTVYRGDRDGLTKLPPSSVTKAPDGKVIAARGWHILTALQVNARSAELARFVVPADGGFVKTVGVSEAYVGRATIRYDRRTDTLTDTRSHLKYRPRGGYFVATDGSGRRFDTGWKTYVGFSNFSAVLTSPELRGPFLGILVWTIAFAGLSVLSTFLLGLLLAVALDHSRLRGRRVYRSLLLLPYALPAFISLLVWKSMYNQDFGLINTLLHLHIDWLGGTWTARGALLLTNLWLGFPYMFLICTGVLQSVPSELKDAARVDGAGPFTTFRTVTMPLLLVSITPLLIASFAFNFNNFNAIQLLTGGGPFPPENSTAGSTDILISYTYRLAFGGAGAQFGLAAAISVFIFVLVGIISMVGFRRTRSLEEVYR